MSQKESRVTILVCSCNYANMQIESINSQFCSKSLGVKFVFTHSIDHQLSEKPSRKVLHPNNENSPLRSTDHWPLGVMPNSRKNV